VSRENKLFVIYNQNYDLSDSSRIDTSQDGFQDGFSRNKPITSRRADRYIHVFQSTREEIPFVDYIANGQIDAANSGKLFKAPDTIWRYGRTWMAEAEISFMR
jgi:hypothetical protein